MLIYHIVTPEVWETFKDKDFYYATSLKTEGFIHCSFAEQLDGVLQRYYKDAEKVLILTLDAEKLTLDLVNEASTNNEIYPHVYGKINKSVVVDVEERNIIHR